MPKSHLFFRNQPNGSAVLKFKSRKIGKKKIEEGEEPKVYDWKPQQGVFRNCKAQLLVDRTQRISNRNLALNIPAFIEYISIRFWDSFDTREFERKYRADFGLAPVNYKEFNTVVLFSIVNKDKFEIFLSQIEIYINSDDPKNDPELNPNIRFIKEFHFLTTERLIQFEEYNNYLRFNLIEDIPDIITGVNSIISSLESFLDANSIQYLYKADQKLFEIIGISSSNLETVLNNYDVFQSVNSPKSGRVSPSVFNLPSRSYGFTVSNSNDDLPIIGILDSGINDNTPLNPLIVNNDESYDLTNTSVRIDNADHGTGTAGFAALGNRLILNEFPASVDADAKLLSIKIGDSKYNNTIVESDVIKLIKKAYSELGVKIFVLNISYENPKEVNSSISAYAYNLDLLSYELDILIFISVGNFGSEALKPSGVVVDYPIQFVSDLTTINEPSDSYNNISVGAITSNYERFDNINNHSKGEEFPASYSRRFYHDHSHSFFLTKTKKLNYQRVNKHLSKPDLNYYGGNIDNNLMNEFAGIIAMTNAPSDAFVRSHGTSHSAPLLANLAARIIKKYPNISMQSVKSLLLNISIMPNMELVIKGVLPFKSYFLQGKGYPAEQIALFSSDKIVTLILEDSILPSEIKSFSINFPEVLASSHKINGLLKISATLCFKFYPAYSNHLAYCPLDISFGIFRNLELDTFDANGDATGLNKNSVENIGFRESWSQDYFFKNKLLSNSQKIEFNVMKKDLIDESNTFKLAIRSQLHKLLPSYLINQYKNAHEFSLVITIEDKSGLDISLYDELIAINELTAIAETEAVIELEN